MMLFLSLKYFQAQMFFNKKFLKFQSCIYLKQRNLNILNFVKLLVFFFSNYFSFPLNVLVLLKLQTTIMI